MSDCVRAGVSGRVNDGVSGRVSECVNNNSITSTL